MLSPFVEGVIISFSPVATGRSRIACILFCTRPPDVTTVTNRNHNHTIFELTLHRNPKEVGQAATHVKVELFGGKGQVDVPVKDMSCLKLLSTKQSMVECHASAEDVQQRV